MPLSMTSRRTFGEVLVPGRDRARRDGVSPLMRGGAMIMYSGGTMVTKGSYWDPTDGRRVDIGKEGMLPGDERRSYLRVSPVGLLVIAPLFGVMFVLFLPFFGLGVLLILCVVATLSGLATVNSTAVQVCCGVTDRRKRVRAKSSRGFVIAEPGKPLQFVYTQSERQALYAYLS
jgi:hypothetical protein